MFPDERSLVEKYRGKQVVIIGVNSDGDRETAREALAREGIKGRCFWDGGSPEGPIARRYRVEGWPAVYVIDDRGIIRHAQVRGRALDRAVASLVKEMEPEPNLIQQASHILGLDRFGKN